MNIDLNHDLVDRTLSKTYTLFALVLWGTVIYYAYTQQWPRARFGVLFLGLVLILFVLSETRAELEQDRYLHLPFLAVAALITVVVTVYFYTNFTDLNQVRVGFAEDHEYWLALAFVVTILYLTWKAYGMLLLCVVLSGILYGYVGNYAPGILSHGGFSYNRLMMILVLEFEGFYGFLNQLMAAWIALFLLYAGLLERYGAFDLIQRAASRVSKYLSSGVAQTAVIASAIIGSLNGSPTANAGMTGSFTIPLMMKNGVKPSKAAGIETVASTTGMILPPVMGAAAFVMASILGISYLDVILAGLLPAIIMVFSIAIAVHYTTAKEIEAVKDDFLFEERLPTHKKVTEGLKFGIPFVVLIWALGIAQYTVMTAALYTSVLMFITGFSFPIIGKAYAERSREAVVSQSKASAFQTLDGFRRAAVITVPVAIILASINGFIDVLTTTGVPDLISLTLMSLSGGVFILAALIAMLICIILGLGMPATAAYTIVALLVAPAIISEFGVADLAAHYFVFYATILSGMIPPVAITAMVASGIANTSFWRTCYDAIKIATPLFILPFTFLYHPEIVVGGLTSGSLFTFAIILVGATVLAYGTNYRFPYQQKTNHLIRATLIVTGIVVMAHPSMLIQGAAMVLGLGVGGLAVLKSPDRLTSDFSV